MRTIDKNGNREKHGQTGYQIAQTQVDLIHVHYWHQIAQTQVDLIHVHGTAGGPPTSVSAVEHFIFKGPKNTTHQLDKF